MPPPEGGLLTQLTVLGEPTIPLPTLVSDVNTLAAALDSATPAARLAWIRSLGRGQVRALWPMTQGRATSAQAFVRGDGVTIAEGRNTVPLFSNFQKRFARMSDGRIAGYNHNGAIATWFGGPGHFLTVDAVDAADAADRHGEAWVDYRDVHPEPHPEFPVPVPNDRAIWPRFIYGDQVDVMRRLSDHVVVGSAYRVKNGSWKRRNFWFVLLFAEPR